MKIKIKEIVLVLFIVFISDKYNINIELSDVEFIINKFNLLKFWIKCNFRK